MTSISATERNLIRTDLVYYLFAFFLSGCLVGWIYEEIFYWITEGMLRKRGILYGPWLPIYGFGTLVIFAMKPMKKIRFCCFSSALWCRELWSTS